MRGATKPRSAPPERHCYFNPRAPCGARLDAQVRDLAECSVFQPTRPLRGATAVPGVFGNTGNLFQPTRPLRGATKALCNLGVCVNISTHAPLAGRDRYCTARLNERANFNPRAPCGARRGRTGFRDVPTRFQPTRPLRGATPWGPKRGKRSRFQPTRPLRGATVRDRRVGGQDVNFNPRAPCGARPMQQPMSQPVQQFQPTRPLRGATSYLPTKQRFCRYFNPRAPCGARHERPEETADAVRISTHAPLAGRDSCWPCAAAASSTFQPTRPLRGATRRSWRRTLP